MKIGILALQGAVEPHEIKLKQLGAEVCKVRTAEQLKKVSAIILPGGESTTLLHLLRLNHLIDPLSEFMSQFPTWGICAGAILLSKKVNNPEQFSFGKINIGISRNAYGRQNESFCAMLSPTQDWYNDKPIEGMFIRAPKITFVESTAKTLFQYNEEPVLVEERNVLASTFHPELTDSNQIHKYFLEKVLN